MESNNSREILEGIIKNFSTEQFIQFFRSKNTSFKRAGENISNYNDGDFTSGEKIGEIEFQYNNLIVCAFRISRELTERSGKKKQYELGKRILRETNTDAGIFIFYDQNGNFRFSLIYTDYLGTRRSFSYFKRFTYYVSPSLTNRTFLDQIGAADFSSLDKIKEAFSVEKVTKEFFQKIARMFYYLIGGEIKVNTKSEKISEHLKLPYVVDENTKKRVFSKADRKASVLLVLEEEKICKWLTPYT
jgi:hypothetical protein